MLNQKIGSFITALRKEQGLTQEQLAEQLGVSNRSVSRWENGRTLPDLALLQTLAVALDVSMAELLSGQRLSRDKITEDCVRLALELAQREKDSRQKTLNRLFGTGLALMLCAVLFRNLSQAPDVFYFVCTGLGAACFLTGFRANNRKDTAVQARVLAAADGAIRMKTAAEMLQFSMKYQTGHKKQHQQAFEALEAALLPQEYVQFSFIADCCTIGNEPGPWHIGVAVTSNRLLLSGETMRGALLPAFPVKRYDRAVLQTARLQGTKLVLQEGSTQLQLDGNGFAAILRKMQDCL